MTRYIVRRLVSLPLLLLGIVSIAFLISHFTQGDPLSSIVSERQMDDEQAVAAAKARWGLDKSLPEQYLIYVGNLLTGDLGISFRTKQPVAQDLLERLPATLELVIAAMLLGSTTGIALGVLAARFRDRALDHGARLWALVGSSTPVFWSGLILLYIFSVVLGWTVMGVVLRLVRASMLDVLSQDYITAARARGAGELRVLLNHALRNALVPTLTIIGFTFAYLITGAVLTEAIFSWTGIGSYAVEAARSLDYPAIMGVTIVGGAAFLLTNLATDIAYAFADPRIRLS
jgi:ABC-type dipeptide/oligopeptide/nickel transport system permease component